MKKKLYTTILVSLLTIGAFAQNNILFIVRGGTFAQDEQIIADSMTAWGYTVTTATSAPAAAADYTNFNIVVVSEAISSDGANGFASADANYPLPIVNFEGYTPRNNRWGWFSTDQQIAANGDQSSGYWFQLTSEDTEDANKPSEDIKSITVQNDDHEIWKAMAKANDDEVVWTTTDTLGACEVVWMDLEGAGIISSGLTVLANYKTLDKPAVMAIESGTTVNTLGTTPVGSVTLDHRMIIAGFVFDGFRDWYNDSSLAFVTDDHWKLIHYSIMWVNEETLPDNTTGVNDKEFANDIILSAYPNPVVTELNIDFSLNKASAGSLIVSDITGKCIYKLTDQFNAGMNTYQYNTSDLPQGMYFVTIEANGNSRVQKFIK